MSTPYTSSTFGTIGEMRDAMTNHIFKTVSTLAWQFFFTFGCILLTTFVPIIHDFVLAHLIHVLCIGIAGSLLMVLIISLSENKTGAQLAAFTVFETMSICASSLFYGETTIVLGLLSTVGLTSGLACYSLTTRNDFTRMGPALNSAVASLLTMCIMNLFLRMPVLHLVGLYFAVMVFSAYILYDVQKYLTEKCKNEAFINEDLWIEASLNIYLDVINILIRMWEFISLITGNEKNLRQKRK
jgi:FtsH-binding integral membrane protein